MKIAFATLGCKVNLYDTEAVIELFQNKGYEIVDFNDFADIYFINTCTVTNFGDKKSRQMIRRAKKQNKDAIIVAAGCYAQVFPKEVEKIEGVNIVIGTKDRNKIVEIVENYDDTSKVINEVSDIMKEKEFEKLSITKMRDRTRAYLKIQEGCNRFCTYCIIPFARGSVRSRPKEDIISEVKVLAQNGFKEIVLTGIHVASYGVDIKDMNLIKIIKSVNDIDGIERIRFSSVEPTVITDEFISEIEKMPKVCDHYHLSLQSGCDKILNAMNRKYSSEQYRQAVYKIRKVFPDAAVTTDVIVGFPGESDSDFLESCEFIKNLSISKVHVFPFSPKKGTKAALMPDKVPNNIKNERSRNLIEISNDLNIKFIRSMVGKVKPVLFERCIGNNLYEGHTTNYINVFVQSNENITNNIKNVKISEVLKEETAKGFLVD